MSEENVNQEEVQQESVVEEVKVAMKPKLFMNVNEIIDVNVYVVYDDKGDIVSILSDTSKGALNVLDELFEHETLTFNFSKPGYNEINNYRKLAQEFNPMTKTVIVNELSMRDLFIVNHLKDWNLTDDNNEKIQLNFNVEEILSDESIEQVYKIHPTIMDIALTEYQKKMVIH
jgi:hypothetical protein